MAGSTRHVGLQGLMALYPSHLLPTDQTTAVAKALLGCADGADLSMEMSACTCICCFVYSRAWSTEPGHPLSVGWTAWHSQLSLSGPGRAGLMLTSFFFGRGGSKLIHNCVWIDQNIFGYSSQKYRLIVCPYFLQLFVFY
jgi:hypothetical protein